MKKIFIINCCNCNNRNFKKANAQGCVAVRQMGGVTAIESRPVLTIFQKVISRWELTIVISIPGDILLVLRNNLIAKKQVAAWMQMVNDRGNAVNIYSHAVDLNFSYGLTNRIQLNVTSLCT